MAKDEKKELWVGWTRDVLGNYVMPDDIDDVDELVDDMVEASTKYADSMLDEFENRFEGSSGGRRGRKKKPVEDDE